jgi:hypothetical protein
LEHIIQLNYDTKIVEMQNLLKLWAIRKLTVLGRITVLKTLIIPKITHLLISLPDPGKQFLININTLFYKFIWQNKPEKLKRDLITQNHKEGGIRMLNIYNFKTSLKCAWIRRVFRNNSKWITLFNSVTGITTNDLIIYGDHFIMQKCNGMSNMFWKDVLLSWIVTE